MRTIIHKYININLVIDVSSGEYGPHAERMVAAVENGRCHRWREYGLEEVCDSDYDEMEIEQLNTGGVEKHNYKHGSTPCQQFIILLKRMVLQTIRNKVIDVFTIIYFSMYEGQYFYSG